MGVTLGATGRLDPPEGHGVWEHAGPHRGVRLTAATRNGCDKAAVGPDHKGIPASGAPRSLTPAK